MKIRLGGLRVRMEGLRGSGPGVLRAWYIRLGLRCALSGLESGWAAEFGVVFSFLHAVIFIVARLFAVKAQTLLDALISRRAGSMFGV